MHKKNMICTLCAISFCLLLACSNFSGNVSEHKKEPANNSLTIDFKGTSDMHIRF